MTANSHPSYPQGAEPAVTAGAAVERYDAAIFDPAARDIYGGQGFYNVGAWQGAADSLGEAARRLVAMHLTVDHGADAEAASLVLDVGCGLGEGARMMAAHYPNALVVGVNFSQAQLAWAAREAPEARFAAMDAVRLAFPDACADRVHCVEAAFHFDSRDAFLAEARRVLRAGGRAVLTDITFRRPYGRAIPAANIWCGQEEYLARCRAAGFEVERMKDITNRTLTPFFDHLAQKGRAAEAVLQRRAMAAYYFVVLRKIS